MGDFAVRPARPEDAVAISGLIYSTSIACCFSGAQPCPEWYRDSVQPDQIAPLLESAVMDWLVAVDGQNIVAVLAISEKTQVKYFFVNPAWQHQGIGKALWHCALNAGMLGSSVTVRSSLVAVAVYERLGFRPVESPQCFQGLPYQTMVAAL